MNITERLLTDVVAAFSGGSLAEQRRAVNAADEHLTTLDKRALRIDGDLLAKAILEDIEDTLQVGACESEWGLCEINGFTVTIRIEEILGESDFRYAEGIVALNKGEN